jgi:hypothetical protein
LTPSTAHETPAELRSGEDILGGISDGAIRMLGKALDFAAGLFEGLLGGSSTPSKEPPQPKPEQERAAQPDPDAEFREWARQRQQHEAQQAAEQRAPRRNGKPPRARRPRRKRGFSNCWNRSGGTINGARNANATTITTEGESGIEVTSDRSPRIEAIRRQRTPEPRPADLWRRAWQAIARRLAPTVPKIVPAPRKRTAQHLL